jgi:hypothetical protein
LAERLKSWPFESRFGDSVGFARVFLGFAVMVVTVVVMVGCRSESWSGEHEDQECSSENLLHGVNLARCRLWKYVRRAHESSEETADPSMR